MHCKTEWFYADNFIQTKPNERFHIITMNWNISINNKLPKFNIVSCDTNNIIEFKQFSNSNKNVYGLTLCYHM